MNPNNQDFGGSIQRCPHDEENPYTQIHNNLIRDKSISPNCRLIIIFLLANKNGWIIRIPNLINEFKGHIGKELMYKIINEAIDAGYMKREEFFENNLKRCKYYLSEKPKFKKCFRHPDFQDVGGQHPDRQDNKERTSKERSIDCSESSPPEAAKTNVKFISIKDFEGKETSLSREGLFSLSIQNRADWKEDEINHLWEILEKFGNPIRDLYKFCNTTILNLRKSKISEKIIQREQKCQKTKKMETNISVRYPKEKLPNTNEETSGKGMSEHPLANCNQMTQQSMQYNVLRRSVRI